jgi:uncharacterized protein (DUF2252 family)
MANNFYEHGKSIRKKIAREDQSVFKLAAKRPSVLSMIEASNYDRLPKLIPIRHARMSQSPFAFYRATAGIMAYDLSKLPYSNISVQAIGDCHLMNFGGFATPERSLVFDANDFDETHPATWEWDVKRLATSFVLAGRNNKLRESDAKELAYTLAFSYRKHMQEFSEINLLDLWYMKFDLQQIRDNSKSVEMKQMINDAITKSSKNTNQKIFYKITQNVLGNFEITNQPPLVYHPYDLKKHKNLMMIFLEKYVETLQNDRRYLLGHYKLVDIALKVVGVGSVGTRCYVVLMMNEKQEPLFLQVKEARQSVLEPYTQKSVYEHHGQRVVEGQRLTQAASDIFLGWSTGPQNRHFYLRQLRDRKIAPDVDNFDKAILTGYATLCGRVLARAHAKTGNGALISGYAGKSSVLEEAVSKFAVAYADQTEKDYERFLRAVKAGKLPVEKE